MIGLEALRRRSARDYDMSEQIGFTRYFRCRHCGAGGPWKLGAESVLQLIDAVTLVLDGEEDVGVHIGELCTFDGRRFRYPTESEVHLKKLVEREPNSAFLWIRLGNLYKHAERDDLAEPAFRRAVELAPDDAEAHAVLAQVLRETDREDEAVEHWKAVLRNIRAATHLPRELRMGVVSNALDALLCVLSGPDEVFELLRRPDAGAAANRSTSEPLTLEIRSFDLSNPSDWEETCALFLGEPFRRSWREHALGAPRSTHAATRPPGPTLRQEDAVVGRNARCPCGSERKYKKCCGRP